MTDQGDERCEIPDARIMRYKLEAQRFAGTISYPQFLSRVVILGNRVRLCRCPDCTAARVLKEIEGA